MRKSILKISSVLMGLALMASCSNEDEKGIGQGTATEGATKDVQFAFNLSDVNYNVTKSDGGEDDDDCIDPDDTDAISDLYAIFDVTLHNGHPGQTQQYIVKPIKYRNGKYVTDYISLAAVDSEGCPTKHTLNNFYLSDVDYYDCEHIKYAGVSDPDLEDILPEYVAILPTDIDMTEADFDKNPIELYALCYEMYEPESFGIVLPSTGLSSLTCIPLFVDICNPCEGRERDGGNEHSGEWDKKASVKVEVEKYVKKDHRWYKDAYEYEKTFTNSEYATICFEDRGLVDDENEKFDISVEILGTGMVIEMKDVPLSLMYEWKESCYYETAYGASEDASGYWHLYLCDFENERGEEIQGFCSDVDLLNRPTHKPTWKDFLFEIEKVYCCHKHNCNCNEGGHPDSVE